jgi:hypothetical protein
VEGDAVSDAVIIRRLYFIRAQTTDDKLRGLPLDLIEMVRAGEVSE